MVACTCYHCVCRDLHPHEDISPALVTTACAETCIPLCGPHQHLVPYHRVCRDPQPSIYTLCKGGDLVDSITHCITSPALHTTACAEWGVCMEVLVAVRSTWKWVPGDVVPVVVPLDDGPLVLRSSITWRTCCGVPVVVPIVVCSHKWIESIPILGLAVRGGSMKEPLPLTLPCWCTSLPVCISCSTLDARGDQ